MRNVVEIGYRVTYEKLDENGVGHGVWIEDITKRNYKANIIKNYSRNSEGESINDNNLLADNVSIVADAFALTNFTSIIYCKVMGVKWKVASVDATNRPRLIITLGGLYNEEQD